jgi:flagellar basal-body rod protein FlgB
VSTPYVFQIAAQSAAWQSARQSAIAANVANANTPGYRAVDLKPFSVTLAATELEMSATNPMHMAPAPAESGALREVAIDPAQETLSGNSVNIEKEMMKLGDVNRGYALTTNIARVFQHMLVSVLK